MLRLINIRKAYKTFNFTQTALDGVSVAFRDNEFVAILGQSGSGKTTMLNIIGGLDHYDSGDLEIDGVSTEMYGDSDWDIYRNNRIGFVFQSYNLIAHQTVIANVELALTLSGVSKAERKERAYQALKEVGLEDHVRKLPNQLSGGQMQRVALARALINDPEILLADEPTGALDTKTSEQVMELLKQIAKDRLVVMVTHNPELADDYANRIIQLQDGQVISDTNPLDPDKEEQREVRPPHKVSMSFFTAIALSLSNLLTKKGRTFVTALAGSIGIIGIAAILSLANGMNAYIAEIEEETMSIYPLSVQDTGMDLSALLNVGGPTDTNDTNNDNGTGIRERKIVESLFESQSENDLKSLKSHILDNEKDIIPYVKNIQYTYNLTPQIYLADTTQDVYRVNPDSLFRSYGIGGGSGGGIMSMFGGGMSVFNELPGDVSMYDYQYEVMAGRWPTKYDETVLVLLPDGSISDFMLYSIGIRDREELANMLDAFIRNPDKEVELDNSPIAITYDKLLNAKLKVISAADRYEYDDNFNVWMDRSDNKEFMSNLLKKGIDLKVVGVVKPGDESTVTSLEQGINYTPDLIEYLMEEATSKKIVQNQLEKPLVNVLTGRTFAEEKDEDANAGFNFADLIEIDESAISNAFKFDESKLNFDMSGLENNLSFDMSSLEGNLDLSNLEGSLDFDLSALGDIAMPEFNINELTVLIGEQINIPADEIIDILQVVVEGFLLEVAGMGPLQPEEYMTEFLAYLARSDVQASIDQQIGGLLIEAQIMVENIEQVVQTYINGLLQTFIAQLVEQMQAQIQSQMAIVMTEIQRQIQTQLGAAMGSLPTQIQRELEAAMSGLPAQMGEALNIDQEAFTSAFNVKMEEKEIMELMNTMMNQTERTAESNLSLLGYADPAAPTQISFYPSDFTSKEIVVNFLNDYNDKMEAMGKSDKVITYTDIIGVMMSSVTEIVDMISYALIAFVAISLVVSSIMIGVITYISVLERKKEIGILRALGASKGNVRLVFNAETLIIGFVAGVLGIAITQVISIIANIIVLAQLGIKNISQLPIGNAIVLITISMILAFISGLFPASSAARKDPVEALRSE